MSVCQAHQRQSWITWDAYTRTLTSYKNDGTTRNASNLYVYFEVDWIQFAELKIRPTEKRFPSFGYCTHNTAMCYMFPFGLLNRNFPLFFSPIERVGANAHLVCLVRYHCIVIRFHKGTRSNRRLIPAVVARIYSPHLPFYSAAVSAEHMIFKCLSNDTFFE